VGEVFGGVAGLPHLIIKWICHSSFVHVFSALQYHTIYLAYCNSENKCPNELPHAFYACDYGIAMYFQRVY